MRKSNAICVTLVLTVAAAAASGGVADLAALAKTSGVQGGLVVHLGCGDGKQTASLRLNDRWLVHGLDTSEENIQKARGELLGRGLYGKVSVVRFDGRELPYVDNLVNLIVSEGPTGVPQQEILRVLAPRGVALIAGRKITKPWPKEIDEWTHYLHDPGNNAVAADKVIAAPRDIQWVAEPRWGRSHEELASMSAAVTAKGRVFYIVDEAPLASIRFVGDWKLVARDAFNGTWLWQKDIPLWSDHLRHFRAGPVHLPRRLVAAGEEVYVTPHLAAPVTAFDAATGKLLRTYEGTERTEEIVCAGGVLYLVVGTSEAQRRGGGLHFRGEPEPTSFRYVTAVEAATGRRLWKKTFGTDEFLLPLTLAVADGGVFCQSTYGVMRLDARTGEERWRTRRPTVARRMSFSAPTLVVAEGVVVLADQTPGGKGPEGAEAAGTIEWGVHGWNEPGFARKGKCIVQGFSAATGKVLWSGAASEGYNSPVDVFVVNGTAWVGSDFKGYDLKTGEMKKALQWKGAPVAMAHHRCYRDKASERFIFTGRSGIEMVSLADGWEGNNSWIRGTCQYGIMPANGLLYAPPDACACFNKVKVAGFFAAAPQRGKDGRMPFAKTPALEKGPAFAAIGNGKPASGNDDWPAYRHDAARSGTTSAAVPSAPKKRWSAKVGGRLTQPVVAGGTVFVAATDAQTLHALSAADGKALWDRTTGGRIDSAPTVYQDRVLFGSADGWVYCLRAADGELIWRFRAAPRERMTEAYDQLESVWPVHGAVLVQNDTVYASAGRNSYLDGGIVLYRLDPGTGKELSRTIVYHLDPDTGKQVGAEAGRGFDMEGVNSDVLSGDGEMVFLKHVPFDRAGKQTAETKPHLLSITGFLGEEWFVRSYWLIGTTVQAGWGGWANAARSAPAGRILCFDDEKVYGYGRVTVASGPTGHKADAYHLFCRAKSAAAAPPAVPDPAERRAGKGKGKGKPAGRQPQLAEPVWSQADSLIVRAMVLAGDQLVLAGPPDVGQKDTGLLAFTNEPEALTGFRGQKGVFLRVVSAADGARRSEAKLSAMPVFDGMSAAGGKLFLSLKDGTVECWGG